MKLPDLKSSRGLEPGRVAVGAVGALAPSSGGRCWRAALLSARPHVIWGLPTGRGFETQLVNSLRDTLDMGMRETFPAHRRRRRL